MAERGLAATLVFELRNRVVNVVVVVVVGGWSLEAGWGRDVDGQMSAGEA
jgi:hypothetical protein